MSREQPRSVLPPGRYSAVVGIVFAAVVLFALFNTLTSRDSGTLGLGGEEIGSQLAEFAVPAVGGDLEGDANVDPEQACEIDPEGAIRICDFFDRPLVISFWFTRGGDCEAQQDVVSDVSERFAGRVGFLSINVRDDRERVREMARERRWRMPLGHDRDGAVSNLYRVGGCPTYVYATPGGRLHAAVIGELDAAEQVAQVRDLLTASAAKD
ncbi:MAG TPA: hypothetical protein VFD37_04210 [Solirubrobacterales bacterium]|nr:hypothetical protein [Solirubrobacterales bacterium]